ncbi:RHS repeat-associated core domain-containing protein [Pseudovibrio denitrificans]|uniref:RHS repeat-associated core domain-containing protein n=1 Tax=Pseudovibrio denitrificans TaxID=258256 RepID=UPI001428BA23|nr:RHS repeat-associated core domain-containing protein [Pseudovibrio denitrificans]
MFYWRIHRFSIYFITCIPTLLPALVVLASLLSAQSAFATASGHKGWHWFLNGQHYESAEAACKAQWKSFGMDNGYSRYIGALDDPDGPYTKRCSWTHVNYLCPEENGLGADLDAFSKCGHAIPSWVFLQCESGYVRSFPNGCVKPEDLRPQRPVCSYDQGGKNNPVIGNPIILNTGTKYHSIEDFSTSDGKLAISRSYRSNPIGRSKSINYVPLGLPGGWQFSFLMELQLGDFSGSPSSPNAHVTLIAPDGSPYDFKLNNGGAWEPDAEQGASSSAYSLVYQGILPSDLSSLKSSASNWLVKGPDDRTWNLTSFSGVNSPSRYDVARPITVKDRTGYTWTYSYDSTDRRLLSITDTYDRKVSFAWNYFHVTSLSNVSGSLPYPEVISEITFPDGTKASYEFDPAPASSGPSTGKVQRLVAVRWKNGSDAIIDGKTYHYENTSFPNALTGITDNRGVRISTYAYDNFGRAISTEGAAGTNKYTVEYGTSGNHVTRRITNPLGKNTTFKFSRVGSSNFDIQLAEVDGEASTNCVASNSSYTYDSNRYIATTTDEEGRVTTYVRDSKGRPTQITEATGTADERVTTINWHGTYNVPTLVAHPNLTAVYTYDTSGQLTSVTETDTTTHTAPYPTNGQTRSWYYSYTSAGKLSAIDGPLSGPSDTVRYGYDSAGNLTSIVNELGHQTTVLGVNLRGQPTHVQNENGIHTTLSYDDNGWLKTVILDPSGIASGIDFTYDAVGQITRVQTSSGQTMSYTYDDARRLIFVENSKAERVGYTYDLMGNVTQTQVKSTFGWIQYEQQRIYDELGRLLRTVGANARVWKYAYNKLGELEQITDPRENVWIKGYDALGRLLQTKSPSAAQVIRKYDIDNNLNQYIDPRGVTTQFVYNGFGEIIQETSLDTGSVVYTREPRGLISSRTDGRGLITNYQYDLAGRLTHVLYPSAPNENVMLSYDNVLAGNKGIGRLTSRQDEAGQTHFTYDALGRVLSETRVIGVTNYQVAYQYDADGHLIKMVYPSGRIVSFMRDSEGLVRQVSTQTSGGDTPQLLAKNITWLPYGPLESIEYGNNLRLLKTFSRNYDVETISVSNVTDGSAVTRRSHAYADKLNLTHVRDDLSGLTLSSYWYSEDNQLQNATGPWGSNTYYYDGSGNRTYKISQNAGNSSSQIYNYPWNSNQLSSILLSNGSSRFLSYDAAGNLLTDIVSEGTKAYAYNTASRLSQVTINNVLKGQYTYNSNGQLVIRQINNADSPTTLHYVHDLEGNIIAEIDSSGATTREYVWIEHRNAAFGSGKASGAATPLAAIQISGSSPAQIYTVHPDRLDRPMEIADNSGSIVWRATYRPFGAVHQIVGSLTSHDSRFPGQWYQLESGLHYNWHRHYDSTLGRYTQPDPLGLVDGPNRYAYARNSPAMYTDPRGELAPALYYGGQLIGGALILTFGIYENWQNQPINWQNQPICFPSEARSGAGKNDNHGDSGREAGKREKQIQDLIDAIANSTGREKKRLKDKLRNIQEDIKRKAKGETHGKRGKGFR